MPRHGIFVEQRLRNLVADGRVKARVVAPVPWFPLRGGLFGRYGVYPRIPRAETRHEIDVSHPRYPVIPKIGMSVAPYLMYHGVVNHMKQLTRTSSPPDLIDAHYFYPDGVVAVEIGRKVGLPVVVTARGSDINLIAEYRYPRRAIVRAAKRCAGIVAVSGALKQRLIDLGIAEDRIHVLRNGVDLELFRPADGAQIRKKFGRGLRLLLSVGTLTELKGHHLAIAALPLLSDYRLLIVGEGKMERQLKQLVQDYGVADRVAFVRYVDQADLSQYYSAADALVLMSSREGMPNVLLESIACGTPVIANNVGGIAEVIANSVAGVLLRERTAASLVVGVRELFGRMPSRTSTRAYAENFSWHDTVQGQIDLFESILS